MAGRSAREPQQPTCSISDVVRSGLKNRRMKNQDLLKFQQFAFAETAEPTLSRNNVTICFDTAFNPIESVSRISNTHGFVAAVCTMAAKRWNVPSL